MDAGAEVEGSPEEQAIGDINNCGNKVGVCQLSIRRPV